MAGSRANAGACPTFIDLFSGCGGFSLGLKRAGFKCLAAIDFDDSAVKTYKTNFPHVRNVLKKDLRRYQPEKLGDLLGHRRVDVIVGGPPCQGFSHARHVDGANHGKRLVFDPRRYLYRKFLSYVAYFQPRVFVIENVLGIRSAAGGEFFTRVQVEARALGYRVHGEEIKAWQFGVPQKRQRQLIVGTRRELPIFSGKQYIKPTHVLPNEPSARNLRPVTTLWEAIGDLTPIKAGEGLKERDYDSQRQFDHFARYGGRYLLDVLEVHKSIKLTAHVARPHSKRDLRDFARLREGEHSAQAIKRGEKMKFPYDRLTFKDRFTRQRRSGLCSTVVAHVSKDGLMFIHPTQNRSLTVREVARVQSFPDWFSFPERTPAFRLIGNAVPPLVGEALGRGIRKFLNESIGRSHSQNQIPVPLSEKQALDWLVPVFTAAGQRMLRDVSRAEFLRAWSSIGYLHFWLHPDSALANGNWVLDRRDEKSALNRVAPDLVSPIFELSGWPMSLVPIAIEGHRRLSADKLRVRDFYCSAAHIAGASRFVTKH